MHLHATYVSDYFKNEAAGHGDREADCSIINSEDNLEEYKETEEWGQEGVSGEGGVVCVLSLEDRAGGEGAFFCAVESVVVWVVTNEKMSCSVERHCEKTLVA
jgi:hypothetical protein